MKSTLLIFFLLVVGVAAVVIYLYYVRSVVVFSPILPETAEHPINEQESDTPPPPQASTSSPISVGAGERPTSAPSTPSSAYPLHRNITATVFWVGEPQGLGSSEDNALSAWDDQWQTHFGGFDDPFNRKGYYPVGFIPKENPFYLDFPYNDFDDDGKRKENAAQVIPWSQEKSWGIDESMLKNRWVKLIRNGTVCYGQIEDAGPYEYDDHGYVFGTAKPKNTLANQAGLDVSPALRDCLKFEGQNNDDNKVDWQWVAGKDVLNGPWKEIVTTSQINWD